MVRYIAQAGEGVTYLVYSIERVGTVLGLRDLGWYERGARVLIRRQDKKKGSWHGRSLGADAGKAYETALAILFLSRATYPPKKGATTPADRIDTISPSEKVPMIAKVKSNARAFEIYLSLEPKARAIELIAGYVAGGTPPDPANVATAYGAIGAADSAVAWYRPRA